ncbi:MAG: type II toxin-antitoxin system HicB family antitoxin [Acidobacteria bacterium]|jgi:predicted RNase H-like HicB family nuclease|nr:type II toxin-antitoxin system HicB family antitoxin [Acidobacteriota bacterium]
MKDYHINIFYSEEDQGYIADIPDLKHCSAFGKSRQDALTEVEIAKEAWLEAAKREKKPIPKPRYKPVIYQMPA